MVRTRRRAGRVHRARHVRPRCRVATWFGLRLTSLPAVERRLRADRAIDLVGLTDFADALPKTTSGGMKQRCAIARAYAVDPEVLLMDEPFGALDALTRVRLQDQLLATWSHERRTVVFVPHHVDEAVYLARRVVVMAARSGRVHRIMAVDPGPWWWTACHTSLRMRVNSVDSRSSSVLGQGTYSRPFSATATALGLSAAGCSSGPDDGTTRIRFGYIADYNGAGLLAVADRQGGCVCSTTRTRATARTRCGRPPARTASTGPRPAPGPCPWRRHRASAWSPSTPLVRQPTSTICGPTARPTEPHPRPVTASVDTAPVAAAEPRGRGRWRGGGRSSNRVL
ncbi:energy-coupling factor transporter ATP-binding protein EcfA2 [Streptomyces sp. MAA16]|nr:energy-coupling factor transporter ATP-binding protein EcfA2 [Streptomyces sp. MAA16]